MSLENNISAFPLDEGHISAGVNKDFAGMTLLDYFAAEYIPKDIQKPKSFKHYCKWFFGMPYQSSAADYKDISRHAYLQAAAMLEERKKYIN